MMKYRMDYSNHFHLLLVSVSKHLYILKNRMVKYQKKKMDYNLKNLKSADRELVVHYLIADHFSGTFYGEIHSSHKMISVEEFIYRAWSKKENFPFCGMPTMLSVPKTIESKELMNLVLGLGIETINPSGGFMAGVKHLQIWERAVQYAYLILDKPQPTFEEIQKSNLELCKWESGMQLRRNDKDVGKKIEIWEDGLKDLNLPPPYEEFMTHCKNTVKKESINYPPLRFGVYSVEDERDDGVFIFGEEREEIIERYYDLNEALNFGEIRGLKSKIQSLIADDPIFIGSHELMGHFEYMKGNFKRGLKSYSKAVKIADNIIPKGFNGFISDGEIKNRYFLRSLHGLGLSYLKLKKFREVVDSLERLLGYSPSDRGGVSYILGVACLYLNELGKAREYLSGMLHSYTPSRYNLGLVLFKEKEFEEAVMHLRHVFLDNRLIVEILTGKLNLFEIPESGDMFSPIRDTHDYLEDNMELWISDHKALAFLKALFNHPKVIAENQQYAELKGILDRENDLVKRVPLVNTEESFLNCIDKSSSGVICADILPL